MSIVSGRYSNKAPRAIVLAYVCLEGAVNTTESTIEQSK